MDKAALVARIIEKLEAEMATLMAAIEVSRENATGAEAKAEDQYDTRALESSYLANGQGRRIAELREEIAAYRALSVRGFSVDELIALGALVELETRGGRDLYLLGPASGGVEVPAGGDGRAVLVVTPQSPLGRGLLGKTVGAVVRLEGGRELRVVGVE